MRFEEDGERRLISEEYAHSNNCSIVSNVIVCPYCNEEQEYQGGRHHSEVFFSEGNHKLECYGCGNVFRVNTEIRYVYEVEGIGESKV